LEADFQPTLKFGFILRNRIAAQSPHCQFFTMRLKSKSEEIPKPGKTGKGFAKGLCPSIFSRPQSPMLFGQKRPFSLYFRVEMFCPMEQ
jgi:hypothetical protein